MNYVLPIALYWLFSFWQDGDFHSFIPFPHPIFAMPNYRCQYYLFMVKYLSRRFTARTIYWRRTISRLKFSVRSPCSVQCIPQWYDQSTTSNVILQKFAPIIIRKMVSFLNLTSCKYNYSTETKLHCDDVNDAFICFLSCFVLYAKVWVV